MTHEMEIAAEASAGGFTRGVPHKYAPPSGTPCANCATPLRGPWCYACGQSGEDFHRSIFRLAGEVVEGLIHLDGRLWRTVPDLMLRPARLTRRYLDGHRAPQIPPPRLFLVVLLAIFVIGGATGSGLMRLNESATATVNGKPVKGVDAKTLDDLTPEQRRKISDGLQKVKVDMDVHGDPRASSWLQERISRAFADPEKFQLVIEQWAERFAILMLPVATLLLSLLFVFQRRFYLFDHTIFALHSLSAVGLMAVAALVIGAVGGNLGGAALAPAPVHLFFHMRGVYRTSIAGTLLRMAVLFAGSTVAVAALAVGLFAVGLNGMGS